MSFVVVLPQKRKITSLDEVRFLSPKEIVTYRSFSNKASGYMWFLERVAAKKAIQLYFARNRRRYIPWNTIEITHVGNTLPSYKILKGRFLKDEKNTSISLSHVRNIAIGGIAHKEKDGSLGVHIERVRNFKRDFLKAFLNKIELKDLKRFKKKESRNTYATALWSIKEAYLKSEKVHSHPREVLVKRIRKNHYEICDPIHTKIVLGSARFWSPQKGFVASEVYIK